MTILDQVGESEAQGSFSHQILSILRDGREATLATLRPDGWPQATAINYANDETRAYFACAATSQKAHNIECDDRISLAIVVPYPQYGPIFGLSLAGKARRLNSPDDIAHVLDLWKDRHPYSVDRVERDDRTFAFYAVEPIVVTMLDYRKSLGWGPQD